MSNLKYSVEIEFLSKGGPAAFGQFQKFDFGKKLEKDLSHASAGFGSTFGKSLDGAVDSIGSAVVGGLASAAAIGGGILATGLTAAIKEGVSFAAFQENAKMGIASVRSMLGDVPFDDALRGAADTTERLRKAAATLPGEFRDVLSAFQSILPVATTTGIAMQRVENLAARGVAAAAALGVNQSVAGHELAAYIEGRANSRMPLISRLGLHPTEDKKLTSEQRFAKVEGLYSKLDPSIAEYTKTWEGLTSTAKDSARQVAKTFADPLFSAVKLQLGNGLDWFAKNEDAVAAWATKLGEGVRYAFDQGVDFAKKWIPIAITFGRTLYAELQRGIALIDPYLRKFGGMAERFMTDPNAGHKLVSAGAGLLGAKAATSAMSFGGDALGGIARLGQFAAATGASLGTLGIAGGVGAASLAVLGAGAYGVVQNLTDANSIYYAAAWEHVAAIKANAEKLTAAGSPVVGLLEKLSTGYGQYILVMTEFWSNRLVEASDKLTLLTTAFSSAAAAFEKWAIKFGLMTPTLNAPAGYQIPEYQYGGFPKAINTLKGESQEKTPKIVNHTTNVRNTFQIKIDSDDPNRVARRIVDIAKKTGRETRANPWNKFLGEGRE